MSQTAARQPAVDTSYDEVLYESFTYPQTHPQHIATIGRLFGLTPPDLATARVLELGCASGGNLFSLALIYPKAKFTGMDLSAEQVALANKHKDVLGLKNITFIQQDIMEFDLKTNKGKFDYIICHGVYSWVPDNVREKILELCDACLSEHGLTVISYNTLPGWNAVKSLRDMMLFHVKRFDKPDEKIRQARGLLEFLLESIPKDRVGYRSTIEEELKLLKGANDSYLFHDHLESNNNPFYFHEFAGAANEHGLSYVGDTAITTMFSGNLAPLAMEKLKALKDIVEQEQYIDFIANRRFRTSILCRKSQTINRALAREKILDFYLSTSMKPQDPNADPKKPVVFNTTAGTFNTTNEISSVLYMELAANANRPIKAHDLIDRVQKKLKIGERKIVEDTLVDAGIQLVLRGFIKIHSDSPDFTSTISKKPVAFPLARLQAETNRMVKCVTNAQHSMVSTDMFANMCIALLDGTRTKEDLVEILTKDVMSGAIILNRENKKITDEAEARTEIATKVDHILKSCADQALLIK
jgi:methyltransferase-like protein/2-polyprenyl-3-methyl-5-hydroxy-6-metoxy-1,4-benzoquinol methylase